jgi:hypothetical protein
MPRGTSLYDEARHQGRLWTPAVWRGTSRLAGWWDASTGPIAHATGVSQWNDLSGNGYHGTQATGTAQPVFNAIGWSTPTRQMRAIKPDGATDRVDGFSMPLYAGATGMSAQAAVYCGGGSTNRTLFAGTTGSPSLRYSTTNTLALVRTNQAVLFTSTATVSTNHHVIGMDAMTSISRVWIDGVSENNTTDPAFTQPVTALMWNPTNSAHSFIDFVGEVVISMQILSTAETARLVGYLAWKWGTVERLPASHLYKRSPPLIGG